MNSNRKSIPHIRLQGIWLEEVGFKVGTQFTAEVIDNKIILKLNEVGNEN
jgi:hypothetical protein